MFFILKKYCICITLALFLAGNAFAQTDEVSDQKYFNRVLDNLTVGGYYRAFFYGRQMSVPYGTYATNKVLSVVDPSYFDPMLFLYIGANPTPTTSFGFDLNIINFMNGPFYTNTNFLNNFQTSVLRGNTDIKGVGKFNLILGGIEWTRLTGFTFGDNIRYNRYSVFDRRPWDPGGNVKGRYASYFYDGTFSQDIRFGTRAFKGILLNGLLPKRVSFDFYYGKAATNGGILPADISLPKHDIALKVTKQLGERNAVSLNTYNSVINTDSTNKNVLKKQEFNMVTGSLHLRNSYVSFFTEAGVGGYQSPTIDRNWSPAVIADLSLSRKVLPIPLDFRGYYIGKYFVNRNSSVNNVTIAEANTGFRGIQGAGILLPVGEQLTGVGDLVNNRVGGNVNTEIRIGDLKIQLGNEISTNIDVIAENDSISYTHRINGLQWSRFVMFPNNTGNFGPNKRVNSFYRGIYEMVGFKTTDANGDPIGKLLYNAADVQLKWHSKILGRDFFVFNLNSFSTVGTNFSPIPAMSDKSFIQAAYHEFEFYYQIHRILMLNFYAGYEHIKTNNQTDEFVTSSGEIRNKNQYGKAIGTGFDLSINSTTNLYFRYRWFSYHDTSVEDEKFKGREATIELKVFF